MIPINSTAYKYTHGGSCVKSSLMLGHLTPTTMPSHCYLGEAAQTRLPKDREGFPQAIRIGRVVC